MLERFSTLPECPKCNAKYGFFTLAGYLAATSNKVSYLKYLCPTPTCGQLFTISFFAQLRCFALPLIAFAIINSIGALFFSYDHENITSIFIAVVVFLFSLIVAPIVLRLLLINSVSFIEPSNQTLKRTG
jgi:hypothetical protein